jgi:hypothetical protein
MVKIVWTERSLTDLEEIVPTLQKIPKNMQV